MNAFVILLCVGVMTVSAYQLGRIAERWQRWGEAIDRLRAFRFQGQRDSGSRAKPRDTK